MSPSTKNLPIVSSRSEAETEAFGARLAKILRAADVVFLIGDLGAGKTALARGVIRGLCGKEADVTSPTYTLVHVWDGPTCALWHVDLYRLQSPAHMQELGLEDVFCNGICLIEWPDRMAVWPRTIVWIS
jgi:tRNA threonylcarbamoyladenosine biosynthesis protein TsaE